MLVTVWYRFRGNYNCDFSTCTVIIRSGIYIKIRRDRISCVSPNCCTLFWMTALCQWSTKHLGYIFNTVSNLGSGATDSIGVPPSDIGTDVAT